MGPGVTTGRSGSVGPVFFVEKDFWPLNTVLYVKDFHGNDPRFCYYLLNWLNLGRFASGTGVPTLNRNVVHEELVPVPDFPTQKRIVAVLDEAFEGIDKAIANTAKSLANARELLDIFLTRIFDEVGGSSPELTLSEVCEKITDGTHQTPKYFDSGYIFLSSRNVTSGKINWDKIKYIDQAQHVAMQKRVSPKLGDILLAKNGTTGVAAIVDRDVPFDIYVSLAWLRAKSPLKSRYLLHYLNSPVAKKQFNQRLKGVGVPNLHLNEIREVRMPVPEHEQVQDDVIRRIDIFQHDVARVQRTQENKLGRLKLLREGLLSRAFSGRLSGSSSEQEAAE